MRKFAIGLVAAVLTSAAAMGAPIQEKPVNIVMVVHMPAANDFTAVVRNGAELAAKQMGVHLQFLSNETFDMVWMSQTLAEVVGKRPDGIATTLPDAAALGDSIKLAVNAGIPVVVLNGGERDFEKLGALSYVGQDNYEAGVGAGKRLKAAGGLTASVSTIKSATSILTTGAAASPMASVEPPKYWEPTRTRLRCATPLPHI